MEYTKKEKQKIRKTMDILIRDLDKIWQLGFLDEITIPIDLTGIDEYDAKFAQYRWNFYMNNEVIEIRSTNEEKSYIHAKKGRNGKLKGCYAMIDIREILFFREYEKIRRTIMDEISKRQEEKQKDLDLMDKLTNRFNKKESIVEITLPQSNNSHELKVQREDGRNVGTIDFGCSSIKIITDGSIRLVKEEPVKTKVKK